MDLPISEIAGNVECCPVINEMDTLDHVLDTMVVTGFQQVGTVDDQGVITGVILYNDIYRFLLQQIEKEEPVSSKKTKDRFSEKAEEEDLTSNHVIRGGGTVVSKIEAIKDRYRSKEIGRVQHMAQEWVEALTTELLIMVLVALDISCTIFEQATFEELSEEEEAEEVDPLENPLVGLTGTILLVYTFEASVRVFGYRWSILWRFLDLVDLLVVIASITVFLIVITEAGNAKNIRAAVQAARILRFLRVVKLSRRLRKILTASKTRYQKDGFNLDLSYVTPSCICMALPAVGAEANFLNPLEEVQRFFADKHPAHFLIFNLCAERFYDPKLFGGRVERIVIENHNPPLLDQLVSFLEHVASFLEEDPSNVVAVHCKSGRSRSCVMVCAWLIYCGFVTKGSDAIEWFCQERFRGSPADLDRETTASQRRYIHYAEQVVDGGGYRMQRLLLTKLVIRTCPMVDLDKRCNPWFTVEETHSELFESTARFPIERPEKNQEEMQYEGLDQELCGDIRITFYDRHEATGRDEIIFYLCFHTAFVPNDGLLQMKKPYIDIACTDTSHKTFKPEFAVTLHFDKPPKSQGQEDPWRKLQPPAAKLKEVSQQQRGLFNTTKAVAVGSMVFANLDTTIQDFSLEPIENNLSIALGPPVSHMHSKMFAYTGGTVHSHDHSKRLVQNYRENSSSEGSNFLINAIAKTARHAVSGNKRRFKEDGFDLDLTYITPRMIAMGFPSKGVEGKYRNSEEDVYRFFQQRHSGHYRIINLCSERNYSLNTFHGSVARYPFPDHNPPPMELILPCCSHMHSWLQADVDNIVAVHCKAGKGRTGLMIICYLLYCGLTTSATAARKFYDTSRTFDGKGLTIISQIRYVHYFEELLRRRKSGEQLRVTENKSQALRLLRVRMHTIPHMDRDQGCDPYYSVSIVSEDDHEMYEIYASKEHEAVEHIKSSVGHWDSDFEGGMGLRVAGDVHFEFRDQDLLSSERMFSFWLHTHFCMRPPSDMGGKARKLDAEEARKERLPPGSWALTLAKREIDQAARDKKHVLFDKEFSVEIFFEELPGEVGTGDRLTEGEKKNSKGKRPLYLERELYQKEEESAALTGRTLPPLEEWILQRTGAPAPLELQPTIPEEEEGDLGTPRTPQRGSPVKEAKLVEDPNLTTEEEVRTVHRRGSPMQTPMRNIDTAAAAGARHLGEEGLVQERVELVLALDLERLRDTEAVKTELASNICAALDLEIENVTCGELAVKSCSVVVTLRASNTHPEAARGPANGLGAHLRRLVAEGAPVLQRGNASKHVTRVALLDAPTPGRSSCDGLPPTPSIAAEHGRATQIFETTRLNDREVTGVSGESVGYGQIEEGGKGAANFSTTPRPNSESEMILTDVPATPPIPPSITPEVENNSTAWSNSDSGQGASGLAGLINLGRKSDERRTPERTIDLNGVTFSQFRV